MSSATSIGLSANSWLRCHARMPPSCFPVSVSYSSSLNSSKLCHYIRRASSEGKIYSPIIVFSSYPFGASCLSLNQLQLCQHSYPQVMWIFCFFFLCREVYRFGVGASELTYLTSINKIDKRKELLFRGCCELQFFI